MIYRYQWQHLSALLDEALDLPPSERAAWLAALAAREPAVAEKLTHLLPGEDDNGDEVALAFERWLGPALDEPDLASGPDLTGTHLGAWLLTEKIGEGGMGQVWRASRADGLYQGQAAIKLLRSDLPAESLAGRFARERAALARLNHPAIARLLDAGVAGSQAYLVLELVEGQSLTSFVRGRSPMLADRVSLLLRVAEAVDYAHAHLIVHRDLKPSNVMVTADGEPKLLDFGVAALLDDQGESASDLTRLTGRGLTLGYAAPEQISGGAIGTAADVFSLGVLLYELISGGLPFSKRGVPRALLEQAVLHDEPHRVASVAEDPQGAGRPQDFALARGDLEAIAAKALRKDPAQRYSSVRAFMEDLGHWLANRPVSVRRENWRHNIRLWFVRHVLLATSVALVTVSLSVGLGLSLWQWQKAQQAEAQARQEAATTRQVSEFLTSLFEGADPNASGHPDLSAATLVDKGRGRIATDLRDQPAQQATLLAVLARVYENMGQPKTAMALYRQAAQLEHQLNQPLREAQALSPLASVLGVNKQYTEAVATARQALALRQQAQPPADALALADSYNVLGWVLVASDPDEARRHLQQALQIRVERLGHDHLLVATTVHNLGLLHYKLGQFEEAETRLRESLAIKVKLLGDKHPRVLNSQGLLARALAAQHRNDQALTLLQHVVALRRAANGDKSVLVATDLGALGSALQDAGRTSEAMATYQQALAIYEPLLGHQSMSVASTINNLASAYEDAGMPQALAQYRESLAIRQALLPAGDMELARAQSNLGAWLMRAGRLNEARPLLEQAARARHQAKLPAEHADVVDTHLLLAELALNTGQLDQADQALSLAQAQEAKLRPTRKAALWRLQGLLLQARQQPTAALAKHQAALRLATQSLGVKHPGLLRLHLEVGMAQAALGDREAARRSLQTVLPALNGQPATSPLRLQARRLTQRLGA